MPKHTPLRAARLLAAGAAITAGGLAAAAAPAVAAPAGDASAQVVAPPCVDTTLRSDIWHNYVDVKNNCGATYRVKAIIARGFDSACVTLDPGEQYTHSWGEWGTFERVDIC